MEKYAPAVESAVAKARWKLLPMLIVMYTMSILDRVNVGFAKQAYQADTGLSDAAFAFGAGIFFIAYAIFEIPSNIILTRVGPRVWLARIMVTWGAVATAMMFAHDEMTFYVLRFLLGIAEAGFYPGVLLALTYWFPSKARGQANGILIFGFAASLVIGGPLSGALLEMNGMGSLHGWQWMFMIEGLMAVAVGIVAFFVLDNKPAEAKWLTVEEKVALQAVLDREAALKASHSPSTVMRTLTHPKVLYFSLIFFTIQVAAYGLVFYLPTQVAQILGQKVGLFVGFVTSIPWCIAAVGVYFITRWSDRNQGVRRLTVAMLYAMFGICVMLSAHGSPAFAIGALAIAATAYLSGNPLFYTVVTEELSGVGIAAGVALINSIGNLGGFFAPNFKTYIEQQYGGTAAGLHALGIVALVAAVLVLMMPKRWLGAAASGPKDAELGPNAVRQ